MKRLLVAGAAVLGLLLVAATFAAIRVNSYLHTPLAVGDDGVDFIIESGSSFRTVSDNLAGQGVATHPYILRAYARWKRAAGSIQAGDYHIRAGTTPAQLLEQFTSGDVKLYSFTIVEGWNHWELLQALQQHEIIEATLTNEDWAALLEELGAEAGHPEGLFLPETYSFPRNSTDRKILRQAHALMQEALAEEWPGRDEDLPISTPYEALILASIIEKETARADERPRISGVFTRRLQKRMRLQTDPTVIYGIGPEFNGNLTRRDLRTDTPYNTYTRGGLPPTPIAMPGRAAIQAALHPADGDELYFVATGLGDGSHAFSKTKEEHDAAVAEYLQRLRQQRNR
ncbi:MAG: endolytic transglycosylase MltG [Gammaproteobacteria bacterium]|nr:endolytic transglycosylase MltG [Gammaproteobacteria bacterium]